MKKVGSENVVRELLTQKLSRAEPRRLETRIPRNIPMMMDSIVDVPRRIRVFTSLPEDMIWSNTGW